MKNASLKTRQDSESRPYLAGLCGRVVVALGLLLGSAASQAADQFWVSLGSYSKLSSAETMRDRAASTFYELSVVPSESPMGFVYRVVDGPMADRSSANGRLQQARDAGYVDAWILAQDSSVPMDQAVTSGAAGGNADSYSSSTSDSSYTSSYSSDYRLDDSASGELLDGYSGGGGALNGPSSADYDAVSIGTEELVETAPAGYGLHQLERSAISAPPGAAPESRLRELRSKTEDD